MAKVRLVSIQPTILNGWMVQGSVLNNDSICLILFNVDFQVSIVRYFEDEVKAHQFLTDLVYGDRDVSKESEI
jgi:hypothetical protein